jgi:hypothetical protein
VHNLTHGKVPEESAVKRVTVEARVIRSEVSVWLFKNGGDLKTGTVPGCNFSRVNTQSAANFSSYLVITPLINDKPTPETARSS